MNLTPGDRPLTGSVPSSLPTAIPDAATLQRYRAIVDGQGLIALPGRTHFEMTGRDRQSFLHNLCTNDIKRLKAGQGCEAFVTNVQGKCLGHIFVFAGEQSLVVEAGEGQADRLLPHLDKYHITEDVELIDRTDAWSEWLLCGPAVDQVLRAAAAPLLENPYDHHAWQEKPAHVWLRKLPWLHIPAYAITYPTAQRAEAMQLLDDWGLPLPIDQATSHVLFEMLRVRSKFPRYGQDIDDKNLPQEVGRDEAAISFHKGCYLGQETVARLDALGHVNRILTQMRLMAGIALVPGQPILAGEQQVGAVTSAAYSPDHDATLALGYVRVAQATPGTILQIGDKQAEVMPRGQ